MKPVKIIELKLNENEEFPLSVISLVNKPAHESDYLKFKEQKTKTSDFSFAIGDNDKQEIFGIAMVSDKTIYRYNDEIGEFYVYFSKETVKKCATKFLQALNKTDNFNIDHIDGTELNSKMVSVMESYIIETEDDKANSIYKLNASIGSWVVKLHIEDTKLWNIIKENTNGFSIEINAIYNFMNATKKKSSELDNSFDNFIDNDVADFLINLGEDNILDEYKEYDISEEELLSNSIEEFASAVPAPLGSMYDTNVYKVRYRYEGLLSSNSRQFCIKMITADKLYSYEALQAANNMVVNSGFGKNGANTYDIFKYAGGIHCKHNFVKYYLLRQRDKQGRIKSDKEITPTQADNLNLNPTDGLPDETTRPYDLPRHGAY